MKQVYDFLCRLKENNNREWFERHKSEYKEAQAEFNSFIEKLIVEIARFDSDIRPDLLGVKDCIFRIYRDIRFSKNKAPYKTYMGGYICKGGKKSPYAGYYFHVEPLSDGWGADHVLKPEQEFLGGNLLAAGLYCPEPKVVQSLRDEISVNGDSFLRALKRARGFRLDTYQVLKKVPKGFEGADEKWKELLKHKDFSVSLPIDNSFLFAPDLLERTAEKFSLTCEFNRILNMAVQYALEEM